MQSLRLTAPFHLSPKTTWRLLALALIIAAGVSVYRRLTRPTSFWNRECEVVLDAGGHELDRSVPTHKLQSLSGYDDSCILRQEDNHVAFTEGLLFRYHERLDCRMATQDQRDNAEFWLRQRRPCSGHPFNQWYRTGYIPDDYFVEPPVFFSLNHEQGNRGPGVSYERRTLQINTPNLTIAACGLLSAALFVGRSRQRHGKAAFPVVTRSAGNLR